jgi:hypothetical protein
VFPPEWWHETDRVFRAKYSVGRTVLYIRRISELADPGPAYRGVFFDWGSLAGKSGETGHDLGTWELGSAINSLQDAPTHHGNGTCLSFGDGHEDKGVSPRSLAQPSSRQRGQSSQLSTAFFKDVTWGVLAVSIVLM